MHKSPKSFPSIFDKFRSLITTSAFAFISLLAFATSAAAQDSRSPEYNAPWYKNPFYILGIVFFLALAAQLIYRSRKKAAERNGHRLRITPSSDVQFGLKQPPAKKKSGRLTKEEMSSLLKASATPAPELETDTPLRAPEVEAAPPAVEAVPEPAVPEVPAFVAPTATAPIETGPTIMVESLSPAPAMSPIEDFADDDVFLDGLEQLQDADPEARALAVRVLGQFPARNSVSALSFAATNDPESSVRAAAVASLGMMGHESVFPAILAACADPAPDVRLAAARTLSDLKFSRAEAYARMIEEGNPDTLRKAVAACQQTGMTQRAFDRLASPDSRQSYEAFAILSLLVKAGETKPLFNAIAQHPAENIRLAAVKLLRNSGIPGIFDQMSIMADESALTPRVRAALMEDANPKKRGPIVFGTSRADSPAGPASAAPDATASGSAHAPEMAAPPVHAQPEPAVFTANDEVIETAPRADQPTAAPPPIFRDDPNNPWG